MFSIDMKKDFQVGSREAKILFLLLDYPSDSYRLLYSLGPAKTWILNPKVKCIRYTGKLKHDLILKKINRFQESKYGQAIQKHMQKMFKPFFHKRSEVVQEGNLIRINLRDTWWNHLNKTRIAIKYCVEHFDFDYIIRINSSTYVNFDTLKTFLLNKKPSYCGPREKGKLFVSGWAVILNQESARILASEESWKANSLYDDEAIGSILEAKGILPEFIPHLWLRKTEDITIESLDKLRNVPFIRTKSYNVNGNRVDFEIMEILHSKLNQLAPVKSDK